MSSGFRGLRSPGKWGYVLQRLLRPLRTWKERRISVNFQLRPPVSSPSPCLVPIFWGTDEFIKQLSGLLDEKENIKEVPRVQRYVARPPLGELFKGKKGKDRTAEDRTIYDAYVRYGYTMKEIAEHLGFHYATISRAIKRVEGG